MKFATAFGVIALPLKLIVLPMRFISFSHTRSGSALETSSISRTGPR